MIIESAILSYISTDPQPLRLSVFPNLDTITFELSDLAARPKIETYPHPNSVMVYTIVLEFKNNYMLRIESPYKDLIRHVFSLILLDIDVLESDLRYHFPEHFL